MQLFFLLVQASRICSLYLEIKIMFTWHCSPNISLLCSSPLIYKLSHRYIRRSNEMHNNSHLQKQSSKTHAVLWSMVETLFAIKLNYRMTELHVNTNVLSRFSFSFPFVDSVFAMVFLGFNIIIPSMAKGMKGRICFLLTFCLP